MRVRIGYFEDFRDASTLLLDGDAAGFEQLAREVRDLAKEGAGPLALHSLPFIEVHHDVTVSAARSRRDLGVSTLGPRAFTWRLSAAGWEDVAALLEALVQSSGHHYLDDRVDTTVMASRGEYS